MKLALSASWVIGFVAAGCTPAGPGLTAADLAAHEQEVLEWRRDRTAALLRPDGWLSLVGLYWLQEGENFVGASENAAVRLLPDRAPENAGVIIVRAKRVSFRAAPGAGIRSGGEPVEELDLETDAAGPPTELSVGSLTFYVIERMGRLGVRVRDAESEALASFAGLDYFPIDPAWAFDARFEPYDPPKELAYVDSAGVETVDEAVGALAFDAGGAKHRIDVRREGDRLFVVFGDATNGTETYGGGRFIYTALPDARGIVKLDFNKAYNPPCIFTPYATCPRPTRENRLPIPVRAGEKAYAATHDSAAHS